jgi:hypothetical protein
MGQTSFFVATGAFFCESLVFLLKRKMLNFNCLIKKGELWLIVKQVFAV